MKQKVVQNRTKKFSGHVLDEKSRPGRGLDGLDEN